MRKNLLPWLIIFTGVLISALIINKGINRGKTPDLSTLHEASYYHQLESGKVACDLCPNHCVLEEGQRGLCKVRENIAGKLYSLVYGKPVTSNVDPIEKKPLYHFLPGARAYSLATAGCNLECKYCQNWDISQRKPEELKYTYKTAEQVVNEAVKSASSVIAFTYNEPTVWYEYMLDIAKLAKQKGLKTVMISSGYINPEPLKNLLPYLDGVKIDFKSFNSEVYAQLIRGKLEPVLESITTVHQSGKWLELVHLVVPGYTDNLEEIKQMCGWIKENIGVDVPLHFTRFYPKYKLLNLPPTSEDTLKKARMTCQEVGLKYVYTGNIEDEEGSTTYCPGDNKPVIIRQGYFIKENLLDGEGKTSNCPETIPGVWR
ncbi:AmmeMemoRadiSam system radical SAM enzyme [Candidatus Gottesmanbacteria bacterium]|nr:AmmeMemoRadiSam system radical SAM enzyme [Candidatus Gottesmanbacteria bacterium]